MASSTIIRDVGGFNTGVTALAGGANSASTPIMSSGVNVVSVCASAGDSVVLPANMPQGARVSVYNIAAATCDVFPNAGATINAAAANAELGIATLTGATFVQVGTTGLTWVADNLIAKHS